MTIIEAIQSAYIKTFDFNSRSSRSEFWPGILFHSAVSIVASILVTEQLMKSLVASPVNSGTTDNLMVYWIIFSALIVIPSISLQVRRLHDTGKSGWWLLLGIVPVLNLLILWFHFQKGEEKVNKFGDDPLRSLKGNKTVKASKKISKAKENSVVETLTVIAVLLFVAVSIKQNI